MSGGRTLRTTGGQMKKMHVQVEPTFAMIGEPNAVSMGPCYYITCDCCRSWVSPVNLSWQEVLSVLYKHQRGHKLLARAKNLLDRAHVPDEEWFRMEVKEVSVETLPLPVKRERSYFINELFFGQTA